MKMYKLVEEQIRKAMEEGAFDNLPGKGKPIDLSEWRRTPEHLRMAYSVLKSAGYTPEEVNIKGDIAELKQRIKETDDADEKTRLINQLNQMMVTYSMKMERLRSRR